MSTAVTVVRGLETRVRVAVPLEREETLFPPGLLGTERCGASRKVEAIEATTRGGESRCVAHSPWRPRARRGRRPTAGGRGQGSRGAAWCAALAGWLWRLVWMNGGFNEQSTQVTSSISSAVMQTAEARS